MTDLPLRRYRLNPRRPRLVLEEGYLTVAMSNWFGRRTWQVPYDDLAFVDVTGEPPTSTDGVVLEEPLRIPYLFSTGPITRPTTVLLFRTRQTMPPLRTVVAIAPNTDVAGPIESRRGVQLDGIAIRLDHPVRGHAELVAHGIEQVHDDTGFWQDHRATLQDPGEIEDLLSDERRTSRRLMIGWGMFAAGLGGAAYFAEGSTWPLAVGCGAVAAVGAVMSRVGS